MGRQALQILVVLLNAYLIFMFTGRTEVIAAWQRYICLLVGIITLLAVIKDSVLIWLTPYWPMMEEIAEQLGRVPLLLMILNGLSLLIFGVFVVGRIFGGGGAPGFGPYLLAAAAPGLGFYYAYTLCDEER